MAQLQASWCASIPLLISFGRLAVNEWHGLCASLQVLVAAGANLNARSQCFNRDTPLHIALRGKADAPATLEIVTLLVEAGADVTVRNKSGIGELPDELAYMCGKIDSGVVLLAKRGFGPRARGIHAS